MLRHSIISSSGLTKFDFLLTLKFIVCWVACCIFLFISVKFIFFECSLHNMFFFLIFSHPISSPHFTAEEPEAWRSSRICDESVWGAELPLSSLTPESIITRAINFHCYWRGPLCLVQWAEFKILFQTQF